MALTRSNDNKWIAGVCGGIAETFGIDPTIVRVVFAIVTLISFGVGIAIYIALAIIMPRPTGGTIAQDGLYRAKAWYDDRKSDDYDI